MCDDNKTKYIGVDNGLGGGLAVIEGHKVLELIPMPIVLGSNERNEYDIPELIKILERYQNDSVLIIEKAHAMPVIGVVQAFSFGKLYGIMLGIATALKMPYSIVHSRTWQKEMFKDLSTKNTKQASIIIAKRLYPGQTFLATERSKKEHHGLSDALLLATWGQRHNM